LGDQLWPEQAALAAVADRRDRTPALLIEAMELAQQRPYHAQKLLTTPRSEDTGIPYLSRFQHF
jgi:deoxyribodipyrimidine photolyase-like uncharacterized protein